MSSLVQELKIRIAFRIRREEFENILHEFLSVVHDHKGVVESWIDFKCLHHVAQICLDLISIFYWASCIIQT